MNLQSKIIDLSAHSLEFSLYKPKETHPNWSQLQQEAVELAQKILANCNTTRSVKEKIGKRIRLSHAMWKTIRNLLRNQYKASHGSHNFIPLFYIWTMTNNCNFVCSYCSNHRGGVYPTLFRQGLTQNLSTEQGKKLIHIMRESSAIYFCGGEPTMRPDLPELLNYSTHQGMFNFINTNGSLIGDLLLKPKYKEFLKQMDVIIVSLDGLTIPSLATIYQSSEKVAQNVIRNILTLRLLRRYFPFKLVVNTVITKDNIEESLNVLDWCNDLQIHFSPVSANIDHEPDYALLKMPTYQQLVDTILERSKEGYPMIASYNMLRRLLKVEDLHCYPKVFYHIDHDGTVYWPCKAYPNAVKIPVLNHRNVSEVGKAGAEKIDPTNFHGDNPGQCNCHCSWMQNCSTDTYGRAINQGLFGSHVLKEIRNLI